MVSEKRLIAQDNATMSGVRLSIDPENRRQIVRDLGLLEIESGYRTADHRKIENLRFFLIANDDGSQCETIWWDGHIATHAIMAGWLDLSLNVADSGILNLSEGKWVLQDTDNKGFFYPTYLTSWINKIIE